MFSEAASSFQHILLINLLIQNILHTMTHSGFIFHISSTEIASTARLLGSFSGQDVPFIGTYTGNQVSCTIFILDRQHLIQLPSFILTNVKSQQGYLFCRFCGFKAQEMSLETLRMLFDSSFGKTS